MKKVRQIGH